MSKIRILHTADLHMDSPFESLSEGKAAIRRAELRALPKKIAALAIKEKACTVSAQNSCACFYRSGKP